MADPREYFGLSVASADGQPLQSNAPWGPGGPLAVPPSPPPMMPSAPPISAPAPVPPVAEQNFSAAPPAPDPSTLRTTDPRMVPGAPAPSVAPPAPRAPAGPQVSGASSDLAKANAGLSASYDKERSATEAQSRAEQVKSLYEADAAHEAEMTRQQDAAVMAAIDREHSQQYEQRMEDLQKERDNISKMSVDTKAFVGSAEYKIPALIGGVLGGFFGGIAGKSNDAFMHHLEKMVDDNAAEQLRKINDKKDANASKTSALGALKAKWGDDRTASLQLKNLTYEAVKNDIRAQAQRMDSPVAEARSQAAIAQIDRSQSNLQKQMAEEQLRRQQAAAAAQKQALEARRKELWEQQKWAAEYGLKAAEISGKQKEKSNDKLDQETKYLSEKNSDEKLSRADTLVSRMESRLGRNPDGTVDASKGLPGVGRSADLRSKVVPGIGRGSPFNPLTNPLNPGAYAAQAIAGLSPEERISRKEFQEMGLLFQNEITGAGASTQEREMLKAAFEGANTPEEQAAAIQKARETLDRRKAAISAGASPEAQREYAKRYFSGSPTNAPPRPESFRAKR